MDAENSLLKWAFGGLFALWCGLVTWVGSYQVERINALERDKAGKASTDARFDRVIETLEAHDKKDDEAHALLIEKHDLLIEKVHELSLAVARLESKRG